VLCPLTSRDLLRYYSLADHISGTIRFEGQRRSQMPDEFNRQDSRETPYKDIPPVCFALS
jgi:hypothetical protein